MLRRSRTRSNPRLSRPAFTLVELLIVISIIAIMAAISIRVVVGFVNEGREAATKTTVQKIQRLLDARMQAFQRLYGNNDATTVLRVKNTAEWQLAGKLQTLDSSNNTVPLNQNQKLIVARKLLYIKFFPQSAWELQPGIRQPLVDYRTQLQNSQQAQGVESETLTLNLSNPEILYDLAVNHPTLGGDAPSGSDAFLSSEIADLDGDGFPEFVDAWRRPIRYYRWTIGLFRPTFALNQPPTGDFAKMLMNAYPPSNAFVNQLARDPQDPLGQLSLVINFANGGPVITDNFGVQRRVAPAGFHLQQTYHTPLIISAGPDGDFGLMEPIYGPYDPVNGSNPGMGVQGQLLDPVNGTGLPDNICSLNIRAGGK